MASVFLAVFIIGLALSVVALLMGASGHSLAHDLHLGHGGHGHAGHGHGGDTVPLVNFGTVTAFMIWFGGVGYLLAAYSAMLAIAAIAIAALSGIGGAAVVAVFMQKILLRDQVPMRASDYYLPGTLGRVTVAIPAGGTGEIVYSQGGARKTAAARGDDGAAIERGTEVVVLRYRRGVAHVQPWDEIAEGSQQDERKGARR